MMNESSHAGRRVLLRLPALVAACALVLMLAPSAASAQTDTRCFTETTFCISGRIRSFWEQNGGLATFGLPIGALQQEQIEGTSVQAQQFERTRLELHPENAAPYDVLLGRIGVSALAQQGRDWFNFPKSEAQANCRFFSETGHNVCGDILTAWGASGLQLDGRAGVTEAESLALFGLPISDQMTETIEGKSYTVQWFERARFELHPENAAPYNVLLGRLGSETQTAPTSFTLPGNMVFPEGVAYQASTGNFYVGSTNDGAIFVGNVGGGAVRTFSAGGSDGRTAVTGMKVDTRGRLFVSGGATGKMLVYDTASGALQGSFTTTRQPTFINDVIVTPSGDAFFTDSNNPVLYRVYTNASGVLAMQEWIDFTGSALVYQQGFNVNGIAASSDGAYLIVVQSNTGKLFRISIADKAVSEINLGGETVTNGDGILLDVRTLYVVRNQNSLIVKILLAEDLASGVVVTSTSDPSFAYPTTIAKANDRLLVVNAQFDKRGDGKQPVLPFTVVSIPAP